MPRLLKIRCLGNFSLESEQEDLEIISRLLISITTLEVAYMLSFTPHHIGDHWESFAEVINFLYMI